MQNQDKGWSTSLPARKSSGGVDQSIYASPEAAKKHISHDLPPMKCDTEGCETTLAWTKIERILSGKATWRPQHYAEEPHSSNSSKELENKQASKYEVKLVRIATWREPSAAYWDAEGKILPKY